MKKGLKILKKHLPTLEADVKCIKDKTFTKEIAESVTEKADKILAANFKGKKLEKMRAKLKTTILGLEKNRRRK